MENATTQETVDKNGVYRSAGESCWPQSRRRWRLASVSELEGEEGRSDWWDHPNCVAGHRYHLWRAVAHYGGEMI